MAHYNKFHRRSHRKYRIEKIPNGYLEDFTRSIEPPKEPEKSSKVSVESSNKSSPMDPSVSIKESKNMEEPRSNDMKPECNVFCPSSIILTTIVDSELTADNNYQIKFNTGIVEGSGILVNESGDQLIFNDFGSYCFQIYGEAIPYTNVSLKLIYDGEFTNDIKPFSEVPIPNDEKTFRGLSTLLPINKNQTITIKLIPEHPETILVSTGFRLIIYRVA